MKRLFFLLMITIGSALFGHSGLEDIVFLYENAETAADQLEALRLAALAEPAGGAVFYADSLRKLLVAYPLLTSPADKDTACETAMMLVSLLAKESASAAVLWKACETFSEPALKSGALIALGRLRDPAYAPKLVQLLNELNRGPGKDPAGNERTARAAIIALEKYPAGFSPVFFASIGWYSAQTREQARASLALIPGDVSSLTAQVIGSKKYSNAAKLEALLTLEASGQSDAARAAFNALRLGWREAPKNSQEKITLASIRKSALRMLRGYKGNDIYALLERSYKEGFDIEEKLEATAVLAALGTPQSAGMLSNFIMILGAKTRRDAPSDDDERIARALISALGETRQATAKLTLRTVLNLNWATGIKALARETLSILES